MKVSVCMATYNGEKYIEDQIDSIICQLSLEDELIISDDSSTDNTISIIKKYNDSRIKLIENQLFKNPIYNFENALTHATGDFIFLSDQDDIWDKDKIAIMQKYLQIYDLVLSDCRIVDNQLNTIQNSYFDKIKSSPGFLRNLIKVNPYMGCCMAFHKKVLKKALPFPKLIPMHDFWIGMIGELNFKIKFVDDQLVFHRRHTSNSSTTGEKSTNSLWKKVKNRLNIFPDVLFR
jgi:glycosyltransferase involved in cell wall biosynthesis